jgi:CubicO group peptidase (beta-lactamase class C family)
MRDEPWTQKQVKTSFSRVHHYITMDAAQCVVYNELFKRRFMKPASEPMAPNAVPQMNPCKNVIRRVLAMSLVMLAARGYSDGGLQLHVLSVLSNQLDVELSSTSNGFNYIFQQNTNLLVPAWSSFGDLIVGDGLAKTCTIVLADTPASYYRVSIEPRTNNALEHYVDQLVAPTVISNGPGAAILVMNSNDVLLAKGYGYANISTLDPITTNSVFDLASVSKQYTAMGISLLKSQGLIDVTLALTNYIDDFDDPYPDRPVTVQDLLHHISGLADYTSGDWEGTPAEFRDLTLETHLDWMNETDVHRRPGIAFEYNNSGYVLLALAIQRMAEKSFANELQTTLFGPLAMTQSLVFTNLGQQIPNGVTGYIVEAGTAAPSSEPTLVAGDGNIFCSINDFVKYITSLRQNTLISDALKQQAFSNGTFDNGSPIVDDGNGYGYGWSITPLGVEHEGSWSGTSTYIQYNTNDAYSVVVLSNDENYDCYTLAQSILTNLPALF